MTNVEKIEAIIKSNLSDEMKENLVKLLFEKNNQPVFIYHSDSYLKETKPWWTQITC